MVCWKSDFFSGTVFQMFDLPSVIPVSLQVHKKYTSVIKVIRCVLDTYSMHPFYAKCTDTKNIVCEKLAQSVKIESIQ